MRTACEDPNIDIIPIAFIDLFLAQADGYVKADFGSTWGNDTYAGPGYPHGSSPNPSNDFLKHFPRLADDMYYCQTQTETKLLLSLGGSNISDYSLASNQEGIDLANFIWGAFGPYTAAWAGKPRPLDANSTARIDIDGFDFDIEGLTTKYGM